MKDVKHKLNHFECNIKDNQSKIEDLLEKASQIDVKIQEIESRSPAARRAARNSCSSKNTSPTKTSNGNSPTLFTNLQL